MSDEDVLVDGRPLSSLKVAELKEELESRNLSTKGVKAVLQDRLKEALVAQGEPVVDEQNPIVAGYLARQSAALEEARKRTESETSAVDTPTSDLSPVKKTEASPSKRTPRKSLRSSNAEPEPKSEEAAAEPVLETVSSESQELENPKKDKAETEEKQEESASKNGSSELPKSEEKPAEEEKMDEETAGEVVVAPPQTAEEDVKAEEPKLVESTEDIPVEKEKVIEKPVEKQIAKEDDSDELDYGDDEEKEHKEESMDTDEPKQEIADEKTEEKKPEAGVEKEEKVRGSVSNRRASSPSSSSRHPVSSIVHIRGLTRPFTERMLRSEIEKHGGEIADFWIDKVKSHCFAKLATEDAADKVMKAMHDKVWPDGNPKKLAIVFDNEENFTRYKEGRGEVKKPEVVTIGTLTGTSRAERLSSTSQTSVTGKASLQITLQNVMRDNDKLDMERKEKRGSLAGRLTRIDDKEKSKEQPKEERKRGRSETPPFSRGAGFMDEKKAKKEEKEERSGKRDESHHREEHREARRSVVEEEPQLKTPDQLFKKTVAVPQLYYLPLTDEQVAAKAKKPAPAEPEKEKVPERSEKPSRAERDRGDRGVRTEKAERGGDRDRDRERDHGRDRDRDHGRDHGRDRDRDRPRR